jgi:cell wall-associated NlpC family hydrolase
MMPPVNEHTSKSGLAASWERATATGGGSPSSGFDCSGFTSWVFRDHGASLPHSSIDQFRYAGSNGSRRVWKARNLQRGDLVFFKTTSARVGHAGIYLSKWRFIHSSSAGGSVQISSMSDGYYRERFVGATRLKATR